MNDRCDYCGLLYPLVMRGREQLNIPCTHTPEGNGAAASAARAELHNPTHTRRQSVT